MPGPSPRYRWILPDGGDLPPELAASGRERGLASRLLSILVARGHRDPASLAALFDDPIASLHDPALLPGADAFLARLRRARAADERVLVFGDFDADGLTGLAILVRALRSLGLDVAPYVPNRLDEGHGLSLAAVERARSEGRTLIVTVDTGTSSVSEVAAAGDAGIDVLITDHHRPPPRLPDAVAIVNPHLDGSSYPNRDLAGSGVAFKLAQLVLRDRPGGVAAALDMADLAAVGSLADVVPVVGENRAIVRLGLARLRTAPRPAFAALLREAGIAPERLDRDSIGFAIAPRLNAMSRMGDAAAAAALLLTDDAAEADTLAAELQSANLARRELTVTALAEARVLAAAEADAPAIVVLGDWPVGIIGLVAGRLADDGARPAVVVTRAADPWRGSARSPAGFDLAGAFAMCGDLFERHGGHAAAAGCSMRAEDYPAFRERFLSLAAGLPPADTRPALSIDLVVTADAVDYAFLRELAPLEGSGDPPPLIAISGLVLSRVRPASGGHLQLTFRRGREVLDGIAFGRAENLAGQLHEDQALDIVARLASRTFGGFESLQLEVKDVAAAGGLGATGRLAA